jgi:hypothetical protein
VFTSTTPIGLFNGLKPGANYSVSVVGVDKQGRKTAPSNVRQLSMPKDALGALASPPPPRPGPPPRCAQRGPALVCLRCRGAVQQGSQGAEHCPVAALFFQPLPGCAAMPRQMPTPVIPPARPAVRLASPQRHSTPPLPRWTSPHPTVGGPSRNTASSCAPPTLAARPLPALRRCAAPSLTAAWMG